MKKRGYRPYGGRKNGILPRSFLMLTAAVLLVFGALEGYIFFHGHTRIVGEPEIMVVFGCKVEPHGPSLSLLDRLDTAMDYLEDHPEMKVVVAGGQGADEPIPEAQAMHNYLTEKGIEGDRIYMEADSNSTWENILHTKTLLEAEGVTGEDFLLVSNDFHLSRIKLLWERAWGDRGTVSTLAAPVSHAPSRVQMFLREPLALVKSFFIDR